MRVSTVEERLAQVVDQRRVLASNRSQRRFQRSRIIGHRASLIVNA